MALISGAHKRLPILLYVLVGLLGVAALAGYGMAATWLGLAAAHSMGDNETATERYSYSPALQASI